MSRLNEIPTSRIYSWRADAKFQLQDIEALGFTAVEVPDATDVKVIAARRSDVRIEIKHKNGHRMSISDGVEFSLVLELARSLVARSRCR